MVNSVTFPEEFGGDGKTYTDDANPNKGQANGGHRERFVPALAGAVAMASWATDKAAEADDHRQKTAADRQKTAADRTATAADRVQTGKDREQTGKDRTQVAADRASASTQRAQAEQARDAAQSSASSAASSASSAAADADSAEQASADAEAARDAALGMAHLYDSVSDGIDGVGDGQYFVVPGEGTYQRLYRRDGTSAELIAEYPSLEAFQQAIDEAEIYAGFVTRERLRREATLDLDFAAGEYSVDDGEKLRTTDGSEILTVERASPKWVMGPNGKLREVPPDTLAREWKDGKCQGVLIEESRTNLLRWSEVFDNSTWVSDGATISADYESMSPSIGRPPYAFREDTSTGIHRIGQSQASPGDGDYCYSFYVKELGRKAFQVRRDTSQQGAFEHEYDISSETSIGGNIVYKGGGWYFCHGVISTVGDSIGIRIQLRESPGESVSYDGDGESGIYLWGAQIEEGYTPSSYIPTEDAPVTRAADNVTREIGGEFDYSQGTVLHILPGYRLRSPTNYPAFFTSKVNTTGEEWLGVNVRSEDRFQLRASGEGTIAQVDTVLPGRMIAYSWSDGLATLCVDGVAASGEYGRIYSGLTHIQIGRSVSSPNFNSEHGWLIYVPRALSGEELIALTTPDTEE